MTEVALRGVRKRYGSLEVIHGVDLDIAHGEFCVFVGPSGCGKSTLLRMIAGLEAISGGEIRIGDQVVNDVDPSERGVAMVFQTYALYPHMTVEENMSFGLRMNGAPRAEIAERVAEAARVLQLEPLLQRKPKALSGGQRQRVAIGRAIVRDPKVFLFDEPLSNLDAELRVAMRVELAQLHQTLQGSTMIYVTHDQTEAMTLADKIVVLRAGRIEQVGAPLALYDDPANAFVAGFIGSPRMNFLEASVEEAGSGRAVVRLPRQDNLRFEIPVAEAPPAGGGYQVGVRPEHFSADGAAALPVTIDVTEHLGASSLIYARSAAGETVAVESRDARDGRPGDRLAAAFDPARAYLFTREGARVR